MVPVRGIHGELGAPGPDVPAVSYKHRAFFTEQSEGHTAAGGRTGHRIRIRSISLYAKPGPPKLEWASEFPGGLIRTQIVQPCHQHFWFGRSSVNTNFSFSSKLPGHSDAADSGTTVRSPMLNHTVPKASRLIKEHRRESPLKELQKDGPCPLSDDLMYRSYSCPWSLYFLCFKHLSPFLRTEIPSHPLWHSCGIIPFMNFSWCMDQLDE